MKIVAVSDLHGHLPKDIPQGDVLIIAGDICPDRPLAAGPWARRHPEVQEQWIEQVMLPWLRRQADKFTGPMLATWGNHDFVGELAEVYGIGPLRFLVDEQTEAGGLSLWFSPWSPQNDLPMPWAFMRPDEELERRYDAIPVGTDIIVSHCPPYGYGDISGALMIDGGDLHLGSKALLTAIERVKPKLVICGHIHGGHGSYTVDGTIVHNVSLLNEAYKPVNGITEIEVEV